MSRPSTPRAPPSFAALVQSFFTEYLTQQRAMSPQTVAAYRDAFVLFLDFATAHLHRQPTTMRLQDITPELILAFLDHLERDRGNAVRTRNARLAALRAFLKFAGAPRRRRAACRRAGAGRADEALRAADARLPVARGDAGVIGSRGWMDQPARPSAAGAALQHRRPRVGGHRREGGRCRARRRGLRALHGKGRKQRTVPLWRSTVKAIRAWLSSTPTWNHVGAAAQPGRAGDDAVQRHAAPGVGREGRDAHDAQPGRTATSPRTP
jgi:integrase/recombinase XerD